jgi:hypothetical protein
VVKNRAGNLCEEEEKQADGKTEIGVATAGKGKG